MTFQDDVTAEGEPEVEFNPGIASRQPTKRVSAGALFRDEQGRVLMVEPVYKPTLEIPGGMVEVDEPPLDACLREIREETGLEVPVDRLLAVDWQPRHGPWGEIVAFIFDGGVLSEDQIASIKLQPEELRAVHRLPVPQIEGRVRPAMFRRLVAAEEAARTGQVMYLQFGRQQ